MAISVGKKPNGRDEISKFKKLINSQSGGKKKKKWERPFQPEVTSPHTDVWDVKCRQYNDSGFTF